MHNLCLFWFFCQKFLLTKYYFLTFIIFHFFTKFFLFLLMKIFPPKFFLIKIFLPRYFFWPKKLFAQKVLIAWKNCCDTFDDASPLYTCPVVSPKMKFFSINIDPSGQSTKHMYIFSIHYFIIRALGFFLQNTLYQICHQLVHFFSWNILIG